MRILVTGGAGFIGSCFVRLVLETEPGIDVVNLDKLTYAGNLENVEAVAENPRYRFIKGDINDPAQLKNVFFQTNPSVVVHFAAESHVDRSIFAPQPVFDTNLRGSFNLLEAMRAQPVDRFVHVSTDEVYGSLPAPLEADESFPLQASSPYSAAKAGSDLMALAYFKTYKLPVIVTRASNNYGPYQFPEKLIPLMILNALDNQPLPLYGDGLQVRDWLYVEDHCRAILSLVTRGREGEVYNIGGNRSLTNREVVEKILKLTGRSASLIRHVADRPGHDRRYALSSEKITSETGWTPRRDFESGLAATIDWYKSRPDWVRRVRSGEYQAYYEQHYERRAELLNTLPACPPR